MESAINPSSFSNTLPIADKAPSQIMSGRTWKQIAANTFDNNYACILSSDTSVWCYDWSNADYNTMAPTKLSSTGFISITTGITSDAEYFGCGLKEGGVGWCWGRFPLDSSISGTSDPSPMSYDASWVQLSGGATRGSLCGVKKDGSAWCWYVNKNIPGTATSKASLGTPTKVPLTGSWLAPITPSPPPLSPPPSPPSRPPPSTAPGSSSPPAPSAPQQEDNSSSNSSSSSRNTGAIVGGIIGGLVAVALIAVLAVYVIKKKQERHGDSENPNNNNNINNQGAHPGGHPMLLPTGPPPTSSLMTNTKSTTTNNTLSSAYNGPSAPFLSSLTASKNPAVRSDPLLNWVAASLQSTGPSSIITFPTGGGLVDVRPWQFSFAELEIEKPIGSGSYGKVYLATWHETKVAVKILLDMEAISGGGTGSNGPATTPPTSATGSVLSLDSPVLQNLQEEAAMMASLRHPNIVQFLGVCPFPPCILSEYCSRGNLTEVLYAAKTNPAKAAELTWHRRLSLAMDAAQGMLFLHTRSPPVVHRDFKSPNLLIDGSWRAKISDFNLSRIMEESTSTRTSTIGGAMNPRWLSVEVLCGAKPGPSADVFAFGVVLWELLTMEVPWESTNPWVIVSTIQKGGRLPVPDLATLQSRWGPGSSSCTKLDKYIALMQRCWAQDPGQRPAFAQVIHDLRYVDITGDDCCC